MLQIEPKNQRKEINSMLPHIITPQTVSVMVMGTFRSIPRTHPNAESLISAIKDDAPHDVISDLLDVRTYMDILTEGYVSLVRDVESSELQVMHQGTVVRQTIATRIIDSYNEGRPPIELLRFLNNIKANTSKLDIADEIYDWVEAGNMPITEDGCLIAMKLVRNDYSSFHDHTFINTPGSWLEEQDRSRVVTDRSQCAAGGLHFCSPSYLPSFASMNGASSANSRIVVLKVNPADIAAIPTDYNFSKGRAFGYWVVGEVSDDDEIRRLFQGHNYLSAPTPTSKDANAIYDGEEDDIDGYEDPFDCDPYDRDYDPEREEEDEYDNVEPEYEAKEKTAADYVKPKATPDTGTKVTFVNGKACEFSRSQIVTLLIKHGGQRAVQRATGIPRSTLQGWIKAWGIV